MSMSSSGPPARRSRSSSWLWRSGPPALVVRSSSWLVAHLPLEVLDDWVFSSLKNAHPRMLCPRVATVYPRGPLVQF
jgi:hypothetical protein